MGDAAADLARAIEHAVARLADGVAGADARWLVLGVLFHLSNQLARGLGWFAVIRMTGTEEPVRPHHAVRAWVAGAGAGGVLSARGGDAVRLLMMRPRMPGTGIGLLTGTLVAEAAGEAAVGAALVAVAVAVGLWPGIELPGPLLLAAVAAAVVAAVFFVRRTAAAREVAQGACALRAPGRYARSVLPWQITSRAARAAALGCFLMAYGLPATLPAILLVMIAQGGGRVVPLAPASVGAGAAILVSGFGAITGTPADPAALAGFYVGTSALLTAVGIAMSVLIGAELIELLRAQVSSRARSLRALARRTPA
jgi:uncharacterized membrane protein YbhN (UPF0104 family)